MISFPFGLVSFWKNTLPRILNCVIVYKKRKGKGGELMAMAVVGVVGGLPFHIISQEKKNEKLLLVGLGREIHRFTIFNLNK